MLSPLFQNLLVLLSRDLSIDPGAVCESFSPIVLFEIVDVWFPVPEQVLENALLIRIIHFSVYAYKSKSEGEEHEYFP